MGSARRPDRSSADGSPLSFSWRAAFGFQALIIVIILILAIRLKDPRPAEPGRPYDVAGAVLSGLGLIVFVLGILAADNNLLLCVGLMLGGAGIIAVFFWWVRRLERKGREPLLSTAMFRSRISNLALITQNFQWLLLMGTSMLVASHLQVVRQYDAIETGIIFSAATFGILVSSLAAGSLVRRFAQRSLIIVGFVVTGVGLVLLLLVGAVPGAWPFAPGLLAIGLGLGLMLTPSVNMVQSAFPEEQQGEISGLSRSISNLGSSFGTAIVGTVLALNLAGPVRRIRAGHGALDRRGRRGHHRRRLPARPRGTVRPAPESAPATPARTHERDSVRRLRGRTMRSVP